MIKDLPLPSEILEELSDKVIVAIENLAATGFKAALDEMIQYHRFLLDAYGSKDDKGSPFSYAEIAGDLLSAPYHDWVREYLRLFQRAADRIGQDNYFITALAHVPLRLMPKDAQGLSPAITSGILDLSIILVSRLEDWMTRRLTVENTATGPASFRLVLSGSDRSAFSEVVVDVIGAWESLLQLVGSYYGWHRKTKLPAMAQWEIVSKSWPFLWHHLRNTAYFVTAAVWNEDEIGAERFRIRWFDGRRFFHSNYRTNITHRMAFYCSRISSVSTGRPQRRACMRSNPIELWRPTSTPLRFWLR